jgi:hypothetical protein
MCRVGQGGWMKIEDFLLEDYKLKVEYYAGHLSRMWTRFNFLLTINSALFGLYLTKDFVRSPCWLLPIIGIVLSALWGGFGTLDIAFTRRYTSHIKRAFGLLLNKTRHLPANYPYADEVGKPLSYVSPLYMSIVLPMMFALRWLYLWLSDVMCP